MPKQSKQGIGAQFKTFFSDKRNLYLVVGAAALAVLLLVVAIIVASTSEPEVFAFKDICQTDESKTAEIKLQADIREEEIVIEEPGEVEDFFVLMASLEFQEKRGSADADKWHYTADLFQAEDDFIRARFTADNAVFTSYTRSNGRGYITQDLGLYQIIAQPAEESVVSLLDDYFEQVTLAAAEREKKAKEEEEEEEKPEPVTVREIDPAITVVINNHPSARPSSGLQEADVIYEFLVEGGSTRYLTVYRTHHEDNFNIGPIRSLRPYFAVQAQEHGGIIAHSGYSARTRQMIQGLGIFQIADVGNNFWRDSSRRAPHNLYTNISNLYRAAGDRTREVETTYTFSEEKPDIFGKAEEVDVFYSAHNLVNYRYDEEEKVYYRYINSEPHTELETGEQYTADRIIVRETSHSNVPGPEGLVDIDLHGSGRGFLYEEGFKYEITWNRTGEKTIYKYIRGGEVEPIPGTTWIQVIRN